MLMIVADEDSAVCCLIVERQALMHLPVDGCLFFRDSTHSRGIQLSLSDDEEIHQLQNNLQIACGKAPPELCDEPIPVLCVKLSRRYYVCKEGSFLTSIPVAANEVGIRLFGVHIIDRPPKNPEETHNLLNCSIDLLMKDNRRVKRKAQADLN